MQSTITSFLGSSTWLRWRSLGSARTLCTMDSTTTGCRRFNWSRLVTGVAGLEGGAVALMGTLFAVLIRRSFAGACGSATSECTVRVNRRNGRLAAAWRLPGRARLRTTARAGRRPYSDRRTDDGRIVAAAGGSHCHYTPCPPTRQIHNDCRSRESSGTFVSLPLKEHVPLGSRDLQEPAWKH